MEKNQPLPPALLLARRIRREQGPEQVKRFLAAMEPFLAPNERLAIAEQLGIRLQVQKPAQQAARGNPKQQEGTPMPTSTTFGESFESSGTKQNQPPQNNNNMNNMNNMMQQLQMMQMLTQLSQSGGLNPMMLSQLMNGMNGGGKR